MHAAETLLLLILFLLLEERRRDKGEKRETREKVKGRARGWLHASEGGYSRCSGLPVETSERKVRSKDAGGEVQQEEEEKKKNTSSFAGETLEKKD